MTSVQERTIFIFSANGNINDKENWVFKKNIVSLKQRRHFEGKII
jgi:hypothetical protein